MTGTIPVGTRPRGLHVAPDGRRLYVALSDNAQRVQGGGDGIAVVDLATKTIVRRFDAGSDPEQFAVAPDGRRLYSANEDAGTATITEVATGKALGTLVVGSNPRVSASARRPLRVHDRRDEQHRVGDRHGAAEGRVELHGGSAAARGCFSATAGGPG